MLRPETKSSIPFVAKKQAAKSEFSSNKSTTSDNEYSVNGPDSLIPELPFEGGFTAIDKCYDNALSRRTQGIQYNLVIFILSRTTSAARRPKYALITIREYRQRTGDSERNIYLALAALEQKRFIERDERGAVRACPENFEAAPLPAARTCRKLVRSAAALAPSPVAALRVADTAAPSAPASDRGGEAISEQVDAPLVAIEPAGLKLTTVAETIAAPVAEPLPVQESLKLTTVKPEANFKKAETYCPWNWTCPHLSTASPLVSIETKKHIEPTTTGAIAASETQDRARCLTPSPDENPYLARFLQPESGDEQRIGDALTRSGVPCDLMAARRMWAECRAVNPALTVREFLVLVALKLKEWSRHSDDLPGRRTTTVIGSLIKSMPNAVCGAVYRAARERAAAELARDVRDAEAILQGDSTAGDREWALGILAERDGSLS